MEKVLPKGLWQKSNFLSGFQSYKTSLAEGREPQGFNLLEKGDSDRWRLSDAEQLADLASVETSLARLKF